MEPLEFIERVSRFIPDPRRHRRHYHGVFSPNSSMRQKVASNAQKSPKWNIPPNLQETVGKVKKASLGWAKLIKRIYEIDPLLCTCGKKMKIVAFITHSADIRRILYGIGWPTEVPEFDPPYEFPDREICQLLPWTEDGFAPLEDEILPSVEAGPDPPFIDCSSDSPHWEDCSIHLS